MYITRALIGRKPCLDQAIQTQKSKLLSREFFKNMAECYYFIKQLLYGFRVYPNTWKSSVQELIMREKSLAFGSCFARFFATFPRVWIRPSKHGNHKVIVY